MQTSWDLSELWTEQWNYLTGVRICFQFLSKQAQFLICRFTKESKCDSLSVPVKAFEHIPSVSPLPRFLQENFSNSESQLWLIPGIFHYDLFFWRTPLTSIYKRCLFDFIYFDNNTTLLSFGQKKPNTIWSEFSPSSSAAVGTNCSRCPIMLAFATMFPPRVISQRPRIQPNQYPISFILHFVFSGGAGEHFPQRIVTVMLETSTESLALLILKGSN